MAEAVTHETSGLLFERNNIEDLARQLRRIVVEPDLLERLRAGIPRVKTAEEELDELELIYTDLLDKKRSTDQSWRDRHYEAQEKREMYA